MHTITPAGWALLLYVALPLALAWVCWVICGATTGAGGPCKHPARGLFRRCYQHDGFTWNDLGGLVFVAAAVAGAWLWHAQHAGEQLIHAVP